MVDVFLNEITQCSLNSCLEYGVCRPMPELLVCYKLYNSRAAKWNGTDTLHGHGRQQGFYLSYVMFVRPSMCSHLRVSLLLWTLSSVYSSCWFFSTPPVLLTFLPCLSPPWSKYTVAHWMTVMPSERLPCLSFLSSVLRSWGGYLQMSVMILIHHCETVQWPSVLGRPTSSIVKMASQTLNNL